MEQSQDFPSLCVKLDFSLNAWNLILFHLKMHMLGKIIINILKVFSWSKTYAVPNFFFFITDSCILFCEDILCVDYYFPDQLISPFVWTSRKL